MDEGPDGKNIIIIGGADGFITVYALDDGHPLEMYYAGGPISGLVQINHGDVFVVGTPDHLIALDRNWNILSSVEIEIAQLSQLDEKAICISGKHGQITFFEWDDLN